MIDLSTNPFNLNDEQIQKVTKICSDMTLDEKIGQIFCPIGNVQDEKEIDEFIQKYKPGAMMYRPLPSKEIKRIHHRLQSQSKIPLLLAANLESGGNGICLDGTYFARQMSVAATNQEKFAYDLGMIAGKEAHAVGCNWSFAPIVDIDYNFLNPITNIRTYGSNQETIIKFADCQIEALKENHILPCIKHFPGDGVDMRDQHLLSSVNDLTVNKWNNSYGKIYQHFINNGIGSIMVGHILLPHHIKEINPECNEEDYMPASLSKEILTVLLRNKLGFNGLVVTDATAMIGFNVAMSRSKALPLCIERGCDMILFNKNIDEDYMFIKNGLKEGLLSQKRLDEAVLRIIGTKMANGLFDHSEVEESEKIVGCIEHQSLAKECAKQAITLVKEQKGVLPLTSDKYKKIRIYNLTDQDNGGFKEEGTQLSLTNLLQKEGFNVYEFDTKRLDFQEVFEGGIKDIKEKCDLVIYVANYDTASNQTTRRVEWIKLMASNAPWFMQDVPTIFVSLANPYHLFDVPMIKTYINCYTNNDQTLQVLVDKLLGKEKFVGKSPVDVYCGRWDTKR